MLQGFLAWVPMLEGDDRRAAVKQASLFQDQRITHYWDGERVLASLVSQALNLAAPFAWDIYLLYSPGKTWHDEEMPQPDFWMHQLNERPDLLLDPAMLMREVRKAVESASKG